MSVRDLDGKTTSHIRFPKDGDAKVSGVAFSSDKLLTAYSCDSGGAVFSYSLVTKKRELVHKLQDDLTSITTLSDGEFLVTGGWSGVITVFPLGGLHPSVERWV